MHLLTRAAAIAAFLLPLAVAPASAQNYRSAFGIYGGGVWFSDLNNNGDIDLDSNLINGDFIRAADLTLEPGWITGAQLEHWFGRGRVGLRANGSYTERPFEIDFGVGDVFDDGFNVDDDFTFGDVNTWLFDGNLMLRLLRPERNRTFAPFISLGAGVAHYNPAGNLPIVLPAANAIIGDANVVFDGDNNGVIVVGGDNEETKFAGVVGIGTDILPNFNLFGLGLGFRLELADHIAFDSPAEPIIGNDFDAVHNVRLTAGVHALFGRLFPEPVAVAPPPPPAPPPPAPPAEEAITVCVIDPATGMIREVQAVYVPTTRDTLVMQNGQRVAFGTVYPVTSPVYVRNANWFVAGQPLTMMVAGQRMEWVTFGGARVIEPDDLTFLGTVNGTPVYADADDVDDVRDELEDLREAQRDDDLEDILEQNAELREALNDLDVVYVPLQPGCVFQPLQRVEEVRKVRG